MVIWAVQLRLSPHYCRGVPFGNLTEKKKNNTMRHYFSVRNLTDPIIVNGGPSGIVSIRYQFLGTEKWKPPTVVWAQDLQIWFSKAIINQSREWLQRGACVSGGPSTPVQISIYPFKQRNTLGSANHRWTPFTKTDCPKWTTPLKGM